MVLRGLVELTNIDTPDIDCRAPGEGDISRPGGTRNRIIRLEAFIGSMGGQTVERNDPPLPWVNANFPFAGPVAHLELNIAKSTFLSVGLGESNSLLRRIDPLKPFNSFRSDSYRRAMGSVRHAFLTKRPLRPFNVRGKVGVFDGQRSVVPEQPSGTIDTAVEHPLLLVLPLLVSSSDDH